MKKKIFIIITVTVIILFGLGLFSHYIDSARVRNGVEPKFTIKTISDDGSKVTYWGLGYKVIRYVGVSPKEPYQSNIGVKMGNWFMKYELPENEFVSDIIYIELIFDGDKIEVTDDKEIEKIEKIILNKKYNGPLCDGMYSHKITIGEEIYYVLEGCKEIKKGDKQAKISDEELRIINNIINNNSVGEV